MNSTDSWIRQALAEDHAEADITSQLTLTEDREMSFSINTREELIVCGAELAARSFSLFDPSVQIGPVPDDGQRLEAGACLLQGSGPCVSLLSAERVALNILQYLCGIATETRRYVGAVEGTGATILDTRKTLPGYRLLAKRAVRAGGGSNHRFGLHDGILIKDNHIAICGDLKTAVQRAKEGAPHGLFVEVECDTLEQVQEALEVGAERILLDNMTSAQMREAVALVAQRIPLEASGNVNLETVRAIAETGVDFISVGRLTHSVKSADIGLDMKSAISTQRYGDTETQSSLHTT